MRPTADPSSSKVIVSLDLEDGSLLKSAVAQSWGERCQAMTNLTGILVSSLTSMG
ncbi:MAG: hypothetical protein HKL82_03975 [Acidimicrobiaceae bacterium]|nr:hypothetical protein [Acidimicrobiaceae bacterium]